MADLYRLTATIPNGTALASPATVAITVPTGTVDNIRWRVPPGPRGHLGWQLGMGGVNVIPKNQGTWIIADDEYADLAVTDLPNTGAWQVIGYNTGTFDHTIYLDFQITPIVQSAAGGGDILAGFPISEADIPEMWLT